MTELMRRRRALMGVGGGSSSRGTIDYTLNGLANATYTSGYIYNIQTGEPEAKSGEYISNKVHLQNCLYDITGGSYVRVYAWDENGNYAGCCPEYSANSWRTIFSARSDWTYAVKKYGSTIPTLTPINHSATMGSEKLIEISSVNGMSGTGANHFFYNNSSTDKFTGLISSSSSLLNYDAVDWIFSNKLIYIKTNAQTGNQNNASQYATSAAIIGSSAKVEVWFMTQQYASVSSLNQYLASNPLILHINKP